LPRVTRWDRWQNTTMASKKWEVWETRRWKTQSSEKLFNVQD
jgi:hypothetical protein